MLAAVAVLLMACAGTPNPPGTATQPAADGSPQDSAERLPLLVAPAAFRQASGAVLNGEIHLLGGHEQRQGLRQHWVLRPRDSQWRQAAPLPQGCYGHAVVAHNGRLYAIGGLNSDPAQAVALSEFRCASLMQVYDAATDAWLTPVVLPEPRFHHGAVVLGDELLILGGERVTEAGLASVDDDPLNLVITATPRNWAYHLRTGRWRTLAALPAAGVAPTVLEVEGRVMLAGGRAFLAQTRVDVYDSASDQWRAATPLPQGRAFAAGAADQGALWITGGQASAFSNEPSSQLWHRRGTGPWHAAGDMGTARSGHSAFVVDGVLYLVGGFGSTAPRTVERFRLPQ